MDDGVSTTLPLWCVEFFTSFDWDRDRLMTLLTNLPCKLLRDVPQGQLRHPDYICCVLRAPPEDPSPDDSANAGAEVGAPEISSARLRTTTRETKHGRCSLCGAARQPWIFRSGRHAGEAAYECKNFFRKSGTKCFKFQIMNRTEINSMTRYFRSAHPSLDNRLTRAGRADAQAHV
eukprot:s887_g5.t1